jgi:predicted Zn-dependent protease
MAEPIQVSDGKVMVYLPKGQGVSLLMIHNIDVQGLEAAEAAELADRFASVEPFLRVPLTATSRNDAVHQLATRFQVVADGFRAAAPNRDPVLFTLHDNVVELASGETMKLGDDCLTLVKLMADYVRNVRIEIR